MDALEAIFTRRSTRRMKPELPPRELIERVIEAGRAAPSGGNSQTTHFIVITKPFVLAELAALVQNEFAQMAAKPDTYASIVNSINASKKGNYVFHYGAPVLEKNPGLKKMYSATDDDTEVLYFENAVATFCSFTSEPETITF